jgi:predicted transcriptional regulator
MAKTKKIFNVFFREKPALMLVNLYNASTEVYASNLAKQVDCTYSHVVKILQEMSKSGLVTFQKEGRLKILKLTKKGEDIAKMMNEIKASL